MTRAAAPLAKGQGPDRTVAFTAADFARIAAILHDLSGISLTEANDRMVYARLSGRVVELGFDSFSDYLDAVLSSRFPEETDRFVSALTTNTTHFFRERHHFDYLSDILLPPLIDRARAGHRARIWSAGCSTGEEAYSIALCLLDRFPDVARHDVKILATDIDRAALGRAERASYAPASLRDLPQDLLRHFDGRPGSDQRSPAAAVRSLVTFRQLNLIAPWPLRGPFDAIFCRNVAIYMQADTQALLWDGFAGVMRPGGHLFVGHTERLPQRLATAFELVAKTTYRRIRQP